MRHPSVLAIGSTLLKVDVQCELECGGELWSAPSVNSKALVDLIRRLHQLRPLGYGGPGQCV